MSASRLLCAALFLVACGDDSSDPPPVDADVDAVPADARPDAAYDVVDAAFVDAALVDAAIDASPTVIDAPPSDADVDATTPDADVDAAVPDAATPLGGYAYAMASFGDDTRRLVRIPLDDGPVVDLSPAEGRAHNFVFTPDGQTIVFSGSLPSDSRSHLFAVAADGAHPPVQITDDDVTYDAWRLSPDGQHVAYKTWDDHFLVVSRLDGSERVQVGGDREVEEFRWLDDARLVFTHELAPFNHRLAITCVDRDCTREPAPGQKVDGWFLATAPGGAHVAFIAFLPGQSQLRSLARSGETVASLSQGPVLAADQAIHWSPDGSGITFVTGSSKIDAFHVACADGSCKHDLPLPSVSSLGGDQLQWSPDSQHLLVLSQQQSGAPQHLFTVCRDGSCIHELPLPSDPWQKLQSWTPDGRVMHRAPLEGGAGMVVDCLDGSCPSIALFQGFFRSPVWSGNRLAYSKSGLWVHDTVETPGTLAHAGFVLEVLFDGTGQRLVFLQQDFVWRSVRIDGSDSRPVSALVPGTTAFNGLVIR